MEERKQQGLTVMLYCCESFFNIHFLIISAISLTHFVHTGAMVSYCSYPTTRIQNECVRQVSHPISY